jgi:hypothetical protein
VDQVNQRLRHFAKTEASIWREAILYYLPLLPLPSHRPLSSFTAEELYRGIHQVVVRERNLSSPVVKLRSHSHMTWPYLEEGFQDKVLERHVSLRSCRVLHPNGDWAFLLSAYGFFRILSLRSGKLVHRNGIGTRHEAYTCIAIEVGDDSEVLLAMTLNYMSVHSLP